ncbi:hypothetical protein JCM8547_008422 [Rhodosporidiobolus lusitaniae]
MATELSASSSTPAPLSDRAFKALKSELLAEVFRFAPETFAKGGMDLANRTMYTATAKVEQSLQKLVDEGVEGFEGDEVQRGIYRMETLLEDAIDTQFDLFEIYVLRNTFNFEPELLPWIVLPHQSSLDPSLASTDEPTLSEYERELSLYEAELQKERELAAAELFVKAKEAKAREQAELVGYLKQPGKAPTEGPDSRIPILSAQLSSLLAHLKTLSHTPSPSPLPSLLHSTPGDDDEQEGTPAWAASRAAFVNWAAAKKAAPVTLSRGSGGVAGGGAKEGDATVEALQRKAEETGSAADAKALLNAMGQ